METNVLYYGDNLDILRKREHFPDESVDLIYLDPPFNSNRSYNVLFNESTGAASEAQIEAFEDAWHWGQATARAYEEVMSGAYQRVARMLKAMVDGLGHNDVTAYLTMMAIRLVELHRVLKATGSIYLHCDPTAGPYLRVIMDSIFEPRNFVNEIVWRRSDAKGDTGQGAKHFGRVNDVLLFYAKSSEYSFSPLFRELDPDYVERFYRYRDPDGRRYKLDNMLGPGGAAKGNPSYEVMGVSRYWRYSREHMEDLIKAGRVIQTKPGTVPMYKRYLDESKGTPLTTNWADISLIRGWSHEKLGYATQKPLGLLERIINASSNPGDIVLDPFCGCGTAVHAAHKLGRRWIGIDITHLAISLIRRRMQDAFPNIEIEVIGEPVDLAGAHDLAERDKYQFQWWALDRLGAQPVSGKKKGSDKGIDGVIPILLGGTADKPDYGRVLVSVKGGGHVNVIMVRDLKGVLEREGEPIGILLTLVVPTKDMTTEVVASGFYESELWQRKFPRLQIITVEEMLAGKRPSIPWGRAPFAKAPTEREERRTRRML